MSHATIAPIEQRQSPLVAAKIAWVEVAMDQRIWHAASGRLIESTGKAADKTCERDAVLGGDLVTCPLDHVGDCGSERRPAPIGQSQGEQFRHTVSPEPLQFHE